MNTAVDSVLFHLGELRQLESDRVAEERAAVEQLARDAEATLFRQAAAAAEAIRAAERAAEDQRARAEAERAGRELTARVAQIQADAEVERERHQTERARLEVALAEARGAAPARRWPIWAALAFTALTAIGSALWLDARLTAAADRGDATAAALRADLEARLDETSRRADQAMRAAEDAVAVAARAPANTPAASTPAPVVKPTPSRPGRPGNNGGRDRDPPAGPTTIQPVDTTHPLGGLHR